MTSSSRRRLRRAGLSDRRPSLAFRERRQCAVSLLMPVRVAESLLFPAASAALAEVGFSIPPTPARAPTPRPWNQAGVEGLIVGGTTGEGQLMSWCGWPFPVP